MPVVLGAASAITSRRVATYGALSTAAAIAVVFNAFRQRSNFYSAAVMLGGSNGCMMVCTERNKPNSKCEVWRRCALTLASLLLLPLLHSGPLQFWCVFDAMRGQVVPENLLWTSEGG